MRIDYESVAIVNAYLEYEVIRKEHNEVFLEFYSVSNAES